MQSKATRILTQRRTGECLAVSTQVRRDRPLPRKRYVLTSPPAANLMITASERTDCWRSASRNGHLGSGARTNKHLHRTLVSAMSISPPVRTYHVEHQSVALDPLYNLRSGAVRLVQSIDQPSKARHRAILPALRDPQASLTDAARRSRAKVTFSDLPGDIKALIVQQVRALIRCAT